MAQCLYIADVQGKEQFSKPGITEDIGSRLGGYSKGGNEVTIHFLCVARPGLEGLIRTLEQDGKIHFKKYFSKFNGLNRTEYISVKDTGITVKKLEKWYRKQIGGISGIFIVKKEFMPLTRDSADLKDFIKNALKNPDKYFEA